MHSTVGQLIVFEGGDGIGKSHLATLLTSHLAVVGLSVVQFSFPGRREGSLGNLIYSIHHSAKSLGVTEITPIALQVLHIAAHLDEIISTILPALESGLWVVLDRFWWSTWVYGVAAGADRRCLDLLIEAEKLAWSGVQPAAIFVVERDRAIREEHSQEAFERLTSLYAEIRLREQVSQRIFTLNNNDMERCKAELLDLADRITGSHVTKQEDLQHDI